MKTRLERFIFFLYEKYHVTPNILTYTRIFAAPWLALLISYTIQNKNTTFLVLTMILYALIISTDFFDGLLARTISKNETHDHAFGGMLDRLSDKILIIVLLIPFGLNLFTLLIIGGESILAYNALTSPPNKKQATGTGKLKMLFQGLVIPILILSQTTEFIPEVFLHIFMMMTIVLTYLSIYSHYIKND